MKAPLTETMSSLYTLINCCDTHHRSPTSASNHTNGTSTMGKGQREMIGIHLGTAEGHF